ncbi:lytic polysaccharide monooxygenase [Lentzea aerocolonigenes]|uniref:lytic polysaccharide monooxygenase n=1 Tax=Lentzea aerocolonigenes TaxID=68170 RepID=UPI000698B889|nr:lytic polysaccharide monooxygenase [Lentzea aerocolonigenes]
MKLTRKAALVMAAVPAIVFITPVGSASAHGYVSSPPSRQAQCASGVVKNCGGPEWEPQSNEGDKGRTDCWGGDRLDFQVLNDDSRGWQATNVGTSLTMTWTFTARHRTRDYEYFIGGTRVGYVNGNNAAPVDPVQHTINLSGFSGRQKLRAVWNIGDTVKAFYSCMDINIGGTGGNPTPPPTTTNPTPPPVGGTWAPNTAYATGATVTYGGSSYRCLQGHTSLTGWEPPNAASLWQKI